MCYRLYLYRQITVTWDLENQMPLVEKVTKTNDQVMELNHSFSIRSLENTGNT